MTQFCLSRLVCLAPNVTKVTSSVEIAPSTLTHWSRIVGNTLTFLEIPRLTQDHLEILNTFPLLEKLKVTVTAQLLLNKDVRIVLPKITKLEVEIHGEDKIEEYDSIFILDFFSLCFPNLASLVLNSRHYTNYRTFSHGNLSLLHLGHFGGCLYI